MGKHAANKNIMLLRLVCPLEPRLVSITRRYVADFISCTVVDADTIGRLTLAVHELMENIVKFSSEASAEISVRVDASKADDFTVQTVNFAQHRHLRNLRRQVDEIRAADDPVALYDATIRRALQRSDDEAGLGLARLRAEGEMGLDYCVDGNLVTVSARGCPAAAEDA